ncbi:peptidyl-prolyl cis-trans isomerase B (cyclophilin B) [Thiohalospira halophila DSM 15071]|uniref:Peptidyl-prolyl cis-trans isomerase n=1 Tax=Thiohalospira halophila DSM 15071 TaxID=1123397 RepID=A0A1I1P793_9GAMM|nr:peptidylprolyl isomerase [Thiohalospira halophila]SFD05804.1 peptidyl-prolyl cis-trans isomerase B (cyclophilin B) [Thiohalospira halophila DSM 15071]
MRTILLVGLLLAATVLTTSALAAPRVAVETSEGRFVIALDTEAAPETVENFLGYVASDTFEDTLFHRVVPGFVVQGGGYRDDFEPVETQDPVRNEADNGLSNERGTVAMARGQEPHSATSQFFINLTANPFLDHRNTTRRGWGYAVFGRVVEGMEVVDTIADSPTGAGGPFPRDVPLTPVVIESVERLDGDTGEKTDNQERQQP